MRINAVYKEIRPRKVFRKISQHTPENGSTPAVGFSSLSLQRLLAGWRRQRRRPTGGDNRTGSSAAGRTRTISSATCVRRGERSCRRHQTAFSSSLGKTSCRSRSAGRRRRCRRPAGVPPTRCARASRTPSGSRSSRRRRTGSADI